MGPFNVPYTSLGVALVSQILAVLSVYATGNLRTRLTLENPISI